MTIATEAPFDIAFDVIERRGGCWGYFRMCADSSNFVSRKGWRTKKEATAGRHADADKDALRVKLLAVGEADDL